MPVGSIKAEDVADIAQHAEAIAVPHGGQLFVTTKAVLNDEVAFLQFAKDGQRKQKPFIIPDLKKGISEQQKLLLGLSEEQIKASLHIINSLDTVTGMVGKAGTGKTTAMRSIRDAIESEPDGMYSPLLLRPMPPGAFSQTKDLKTPPPFQHC